jgi:hypothetical protein
LVDPELVVGADEKINEKGEERKVRYAVSLPTSSISGVFTTLLTVRHFQLLQGTQYMVNGYTTVP